MCGIVGIAFNDDRLEPDRALVQALGATVGHRGPDGEGYHTAPGIALGARRLAVIDLTGGQQPMSSTDGSITVVFNGEIYNYKEVRAALVASGHHFRSAADTEVLVHLYEERGLDCLQELRGMFAFALWDGRRRRLLLARDRMGQKPLHYTKLRDRLLFGSEIKSILQDPGVERSVDRHALDQYLTWEYVPGGRTIFRGIERLPPGHRLVWEKGRVEIEPYWQPRWDPDHPRSAAEWAEAFGHALREAVRLHLTSDVPLGIFLSGGLDSSAILALAREVSNAELSTFSLGFADASYDERRFARLVAERYGTHHREYTLDAPDDGLVRRVCASFDEPFADASAIPTFVLAAHARRHVTVALGGDGGDELLGGYDWYRAERVARYYQALPAAWQRHLTGPLLTRIPASTRKKGLGERLRRFGAGFEHPTALGHARWRAFLTPAEKAELYAPDLRHALAGTSGYEPELEVAARFSSLDPIRRALGRDMMTYLPDDILTKVDRASMASSLEVRSPFLDGEVVELACLMPPELKIRGGRTKILLREILRDRVPPPILRREKQGFSPPMRSWLRKELRDLARDCLDPERIRRRGWFDPTVVHGWLDSHLEGRRNYAHRLWPLIVFELWHQQYVDQPVGATTAVQTAS